MVLKRKYENMATSTLESAQDLLKSALSKGVGGSLRKDRLNQVG